MWGYLLHFSISRRRWYHIRRRRLSFSPIMGARYHSVSATCWWNDFKWDKCLLLQSLTCFRIEIVLNVKLFLLFFIFWGFFCCYCKPTFMREQHSMTSFCVVVSLITPEATHDVQIPRHCVSCDIACTCAFITHVTWWLHIAFWKLDIKNLYPDQIYHLIEILFKNASYACILYTAINSHT